MLNWISSADMLYADALAVARCIFITNWQKNKK